MNPPHPKKRAGLIARQERQTMGAQLRDALADIEQTREMLLELSCRVERTRRALHLMAAHNEADLDPPEALLSACRALCWDQILSYFDRITAAGETITQRLNGDTTHA